MFLGGGYGSAKGESGAAAVVQRNGRDFAHLLLSLCSGCGGLNLALTLPAIGLLRRCVFHAHHIIVILCGLLTFQVSHHLLK
jgi:hypothetical protein